MCGGLCSTFLSSNLRNYSSSLNCTSSQGLKKFEENGLPLYVYIRIYMNDQYEWFSLSIAINFLPIFPKMIPFSVDATFTLAWELMAYLLVFMTTQSVQEQKWALDRNTVK